MLLCLRQEVVGRSRDWAALGGGALGGREWGNERGPEGSRSPHPGTPLQRQEERLWGWGLCWAVLGALWCELLCATWWCHTLANGPSPLVVVPGPFLSIHSQPGAYQFPALPRCLSTQGTHHYLLPERGMLLKGPRALKGRREGWYYLYLAR